MISKPDKVSLRELLTVEVMRAPTRIARNMDVWIGVSENMEGVVPNNSKYLPLMFGNWKKNCGFWGLFPAGASSKFARAGDIMHPQKKLETKAKKIYWKMNSWHWWSQECGVSGPGECRVLNFPNIIWAVAFITNWCMSKENWKGLSLGKIHSIGRFTGGCVILGETLCPTHYWQHLRKQVALCYAWVFLTFLCGLLRCSKISAEMMNIL